MNYDVKTAAAGCTAPPLPTPQSSTLQLDSLTTMWLDYMCCKAVSSPPTEWPTNIHHWTQACTHVLALRATQHQTNTSHAHDDMTRFCPNNVPEDDLVLWLIDTIRPVMQANNPHWQRTVPDAHTQCSTVPHNAPATVTVLLTDTADISHLSLLIHTNGSVLGTPSEHDTSAYVSWGPRLGGWGEDVAAVTRTLTLYGGSTAAMLSEWETIKNSRSFDVVSFNCALVAMRVLARGFAELCPSLADGAHSIDWASPSGTFQLAESIYDHTLIGSDGFAQLSVEQVQATQIDAASASRRVLQSYNDGGTFLESEGRLYKCRSRAQQFSEYCTSAFDGDTEATCNVGKGCTYTPGGIYKGSNTIRTADAQTAALLFNQDDEENAAASKVSARCEAPVSLWDAGNISSDNVLCSDIHRGVLFTIDRTSFVSNIASDSLKPYARSGQCQFAGGAIYAGPGANVAVLASTFSMNVAAKGGALYGDSDSNWTIKSTKFHGNVAEEVGGAIFAAVGTDWTIEQCDFSFNVQLHPKCTHDPEEVQSETDVAMESPHNGGVAKRLELCKATFSMNGGGAIYASSGSRFVIRNARFDGSQAEGQGGAIRAEPSSSLEIQSSQFAGSQAFVSNVFQWRLPSDLEFIRPTSEQTEVIESSIRVGGDAAFSNLPKAWKVSNTTFVPFYQGRTVSLNVLAGCEQWPCPHGHSCRYDNYSTFCQPCPHPTVGSNGLSCTLCSPGWGPGQGTSINDCAPCTDNTISTAGVCNDCPSGMVTFEAHTTCRDLTGASIEDLDVVASVLTNTSLLPKATMQLRVEAAALLDESAAKSELLDQLTTEMASALNITVTDIVIMSIYQSDRRRVQSEEMAVAVFDFVVYSSNAALVLQSIQAQLSDEHSKLRTSPITAGIDPTVKMVLVFVCPAGKYRPDGSSDCQICPDPNSIPDAESGFRTCKKCPAREEPTSVGDACGCQPGYFNTSVIQPFCYVSLIQLHHFSLFSH
jgi:hypothetical protein